MDLKELNLDDGVDPWERQSGETHKRYAQFRGYVDLGRTRTLRKVAENLTLNPRYVRDVAAAYRWVTRAEAYDRHRDHLDDVAWVERRRLAATQDATLLDGAVGKVARALGALDPATLEPAVLVRLLQVTLAARRNLFGDPGLTVAVTGPAGGPLMLRLAEFEQMSTDARRNAVAQLMAQVTRRSSAAEGDDDDDNE